jgi:hypothetical protein
MQLQTITTEMRLIKLAKELLIVSGSDKEKLKMPLNFLKIMSEAGKETSVA